MNRTVLIIVLVVIVVLAVGALAWMITHQGKPKAETYTPDGGQGAAGGQGAQSGQEMPTAAQPADL